MHINRYHADYKRCYVNASTQTENIQIPSSKLAALQVEAAIAQAKHNAEMTVAQAKHEAEMNRRKQVLALEEEHERKMLELRCRFQLQTTQQGQPAPFPNSLSSPEHPVILHVQKPALDGFSGTKDMNGSETSPEKSPTQSAQELRIVEASQNSSTGPQGNTISDLAGQMRSTTTNQSLVPCISPSPEAQNPAISTMESIKAPDDRVTELKDHPGSSSSTSVQIKTSVSPATVRRDRADLDKPRWPKVTHLTCYFWKNGYCTKSAAESVASKGSARMMPPFSPTRPLDFVTATEPIAKSLALKTLPLHTHEILPAFCFYEFINRVVSPYVSTRLAPKTYPQLSRKTKINWNVHFVSMVQSCFINTLALWVIYADKERRGMDWKERVWGYTGAGGMVQGFAAGYFAWDLLASIEDVDVHGWGALFHAASALAVSMMGFRPFVNYYGINLILYELSTPFLNIHWWLDKVGMTGSNLQLVNGIALLTTFGGSRLVWGTYQNYSMYKDIWKAIQNPGELPVPSWLALAYLASTTALSGLNFYWFGKMIQAVAKRFEKPDKDQERKKK
ncbi:MAG: hypothetical protein Q9225_005387 [Loekoesia sp. 1 TL-2023]